MARVIEWDKGQQEIWDEWKSSRPQVIKELCDRFPPYNLYRLKSTGQLVTLHSYNENGTVTVNVTGEYNLVMFERRVFGVPVDNLEECDLPEPDKQVGAVLSDQNSIDAFIDIVRPIVLSERGQE